MNELRQILFCDIIICDYETGIQATRTISPKYKGTIYPNQQTLITNELQTFKFTAVLCVVCPSGAAVFSWRR